FANVTRWPRRHGHLVEFPGFFTRPPNLDGHLVDSPSHKMAKLAWPSCGILWVFHKLARSGWLPCGFANVTRWLTRHGQLVKVAGGLVCRLLDWFWGRESRNSQSDGCPLAGRR